MTRTTLTLPSPFPAGANTDQLEADLTAFLSSRLPSHLRVHDLSAVVHRALLRYALTRTAGNQTKAARVLGIDRITVKKRCTMLAISPADFLPDSPVPHTATRKSDAILHAPRPHN